MKTLYVTARNHMDPSWRRCFTEHFYYEGVKGIIRPYSDIEEAQILEYMDFADRFGVKYQIEQSITVKRFLERNPDQRERFVDLVKRGLIELAGGGEAIIDYNMTCGESWARNHLYNIKYYQREFGHRAEFAITPDTFGLPPQLPQFFRSLGYDAIVVFDRVFQNKKPYWKGLDGTLIVLGTNPESVSDRLSADCVKMLPCPHCHGEGCEVCGGIGFDPYDMTRPDKEYQGLNFYGPETADAMLERYAAMDKDEFTIAVSTEEALIGEELYGPLLEAAKKHDFEIKFLTYEENFERLMPGYVKQLREGTASQEDIDPRPEGNPMATGCYTSRIEIKRQNKMLEELLSAAERFAAIAWIKGGYRPDAIPRRDYPGAKLEYLWNKMAFIQFHDCITASHVDASYAELMRVCREVRLGAYQIYRDAIEELTRGKAICCPEGYKAALAFNPDNTDAASARLVLMGDMGMTAAEIIDAAGNTYTPYDTEVVKVACGSCIEVTVNAKIPALGYKIFFFKPVEAFAEVDTTAVSVIENEYFRVTAKGAHITEIFDKKANRIASGEGACELSLSVDIGHPWGRTTAESGHINLTATEISCESASEYQRFILRGDYSSAERSIDSFTWEQKITLIKDEPMVRLTNTLDWKGKATHVYANFPLPFDAENKLICEVPFGVIERGVVTPSNMLGIEDEWASLGYAGASKDGYNVAILKEGAPGSRIRENVLQFSILRSVDYMVEKDFAVEGAVDNGRHVSEFALISGEGSFQSLNPASRAAAFNAAAYSLTMKKNDGEALPAEACFLPTLAKLPANIRISALKRSEDGCDLILRVWEASGISASLPMPEGIELLPCNTLEEVNGEAVEVLNLRPFEIATYRVKGDLSLI